jgi:hypothetical protein
VLLRVQFHERGVVGRDDQLDVDGAVPGAALEVLVCDVAVVLGRAYDAGRAVVGLQEVEEVGVRKAVGTVEDAVGDGQVVALGESADQGRRSGPLEVDVQLGLGDQRSTSNTTGGASAGVSPSV